MQNLVIVMIALVVLLGACQPAPGDEKNNEGAVESNKVEKTDSGEETVVNDEIAGYQEDAKEELKTLIGRYVFGELHQNTGYFLEFKDENGKLFAFTPDNETYNKLEIQLVNGGDFKMHYYLKNVDFEIKYTQSEGVNEFNGKKETQYHIKSVAKANNKWNNTINMICAGMWMLEAVEEKGKKEEVPYGAFTITFEKWMAMISSEDGDSEINWEVSDDMKTLTMLGDKDEVYAIEELEYTKMVLAAPKEKLYFFREEENGD